MSLRRDDPTDGDWQAHSADLEHHRPFRDFRYAALDANGQRRILQVSGKPVFDAEGRFRGYRGVGHDITEHVRAEDALRASEERFRHFAESSSDWLWETDAQLRLSYLSERVRVATGVDPAWFVGRRRDELGDPVEQEDWREHLADLEARRPFRDFIHRFIGPDGRERYVKISGMPVFDRRGRFAGYRGTGTNITDRVRAEEQFRHLAHHDSLTGLPNRALFQDRLRQALAQAQRSGAKVAVLQLDLDRFKHVNDTLGHAAGDALLREAASRLLRCVRGADTVARVGGDEFAIILADLSSPTGAGRVAQKVIRELALPLEFQGQTMHTTTSIGATIYPNDDVDPERLLKNADIALYQAKAAGRATYSFFVPEMKKQVERRRQLEAELRLALARDEFVLHYQPIIGLSQGELMGFEALLRWQHPGRGLLRPCEFVAVAEEAGLTVPIGELVLRRACAQVRSWRDQGHAPGRVSINTSMAQFRRGGLARTVQEVLRDTGLPPSDLEIEVTEALLMKRDREIVLETISRLHRLGVRFALDDFGTGYASLSQLKRFHVDHLKIDQSFIRDIGSDPENAAIIRAVINLGHSLGLKVIAEGVENNEQLAFIRLNRCDCAQGHHFAPPLSAAAAARFMRDAAGGVARQRLGSRPASAAPPAA